MLWLAICCNICLSREHRLILEHSPCSFRNGQCSDRDSYSPDNWLWKWIFRLHQARLRSISACSRRFLSRSSGRRSWRTTIRLRFAHQLRANRRRRSYYCQGQWSCEARLLRSRPMLRLLPVILYPLTGLLMIPLAKPNYLSLKQYSQRCFGPTNGSYE